MNLQQTKESLMPSGFFENWMPALQRMVLVKSLKGEEKMFFVELLTGLRERIEAMPKSYEQDGRGYEAIVYLHYFQAGMDFHITEKDMTSDTEQSQAFGLANLGYGGELGYISIDEIVENGVELDLYWSPKMLKEI
jgi:hypothetical protein